MNDEIIWPAVRSPCRGICQCNEQDVCKGCGRTRTEIATWMNMTDEERMECRRRSKQRLVQLK